MTLRCCTFLLTFMTVWMSVSYCVNPACECVVYSSDGRSQGTFTSPNYPKYYPNNINCILYTFMGDLDEIVEISFYEFDLQMKITNKCTDFVRFFLDLPRPEVNERDIWNYELCGNITMIQKTHYSSQRSLIMEFHTDGIQGNHTGFRGSFKFLSKAQYEFEGGDKRWGTKCTYDFYSNRNTKSGRFFSPRYPQHYPPDSDCQYVFNGAKHERVKVTFQNIQLETIDGSCTDSPDHITVRDGVDSTATVIGRYCNTYNGVEVISSGDSLHISFEVDDKKQRQGFAATFQFLPEPDIGPRRPAPHQPRPGVNTHNPGDDPGYLQPTTTFSRSLPTDACQYKFSSRTSSGGIITSPQYPNPYPAGVRCRYEFQGKGKERVQISFNQIDLNFDQSATPPTNNEECDTAAQDSIVVSIRIQNEKREIARYCQNSDFQKLMSSDSKLEVDFISHGNTASSARGFNATYKFVSDFGISSGQQNHEVVCGFHYHSNVYPNGTFTSPNFPGMYPRNTECTYEFFGNTSEIVDITFPFFDMEGMPPSCDDKTQSDYVEFSNFDIPDRKMRRFCGSKQEDIKKTVHSDNQFFRVIFKSNDVYDARGFQAIFQFKKKGEETLQPVQEPFGNNGSSISTSATSMMLMLLQIVSVL